MTTRTVAAASTHAVDAFIERCLANDVVCPLPVNDMKQDYKERRESIRYSAQLAATVQQFDDSMSPVSQPQDCETRTLSQNGMSFVSREPIAVATHLSVTLKNGEDTLDVIGFTRHCTTEGEMFHVGVLFLFGDF